MSDPPASSPEAKPDAPPQSNQALVLLRGVGGAIVGGVIGYVLFRVLYRSGFYGIMLPGVLIGTGAGLAARSRSLSLGIVCIVLAVAATLLTDTVPLVMMALGVAGAWWFGQGR